MKMESLVIVDQHATVNLYLSLVLTARHALEVEWIGRRKGLITKIFLKIAIYAITYQDLWSLYPVYDDLFGNWSEVVTR